MVPAVKTCELSELRHPELLDLSAGGHQSFEILVWHIDAAQTIQQHAHGDALALFLLERGDQLVAEFPFRPDIHGEIDRPLRVPDRLEQRRHELVAVVERRDRPPVLDRRTDDSAEGGREVGRFDRRRRGVCIDPLGFVADCEKQRAEHRHSSDHADDEQRELPPFVPAANGVPAAPIRRGQPLYVYRHRKCTKSVRIQTPHGLDARFGRNAGEAARGASRSS